MECRPEQTEQAPTLAELACQAVHEREALDGLLQRCRPIVHAIILDRVHNPETADDLTQEALTDVAHGVPRLRDPQAIRGWLRRIAINRCNMWWRRPWPQTEPLSDEYRRLVHEDAFAEAARRETWRDLTDALRDLPEKSRLALLMHVLGDMSHAQIAEALDTTVGGVGVRIHRARRSLRRALGPLARITEEE